MVVKLLVAILFLTAAGHAEEPIVGRASVIDGDTIEIHGERIRFHGIDAPESKQTCNDAAGAPYPCGRVSADTLDVFLAGSRPTTCHFEDRDRYGRFVGTCFRADGIEVNAWMVGQGQAIDFRRYSKGKYSEDEKAARRAKRGLWRGTFENPSKIRRLKRGPS